MRLDRIVLVSVVVLAVAFPAAAQAAQSPPTAALTFILAGQSNMAGHGADPDMVGDPRVQVLEADGLTWGPSSEPFPNGQGSGPGLSFGEEVADENPGTTVRLVQCAESGSPISAWEQGGRLFNACASIASTMHIDGILFFQGESETSDAGAAASWPNGFLSFVDGMRAAIGQVPIVYAQLGVYPLPYWDEVKQEQASLQAARPAMSMIRTDDLPTDGEHFPASSYRIIGVRFAEAWARLTMSAVDYASAKALAAATAAAVSAPLAAIEARSAALDVLYGIDPDAATG